MTLTAVVVATGVVTFTTPLNRNDQVFATYEVDVENASYALLSLQDLALTGAAAMGGSKVYPQASSQWQYVNDQKEAWLSGLEGLAKGDWIPAELRTALWWKAPEPQANDETIGSVRKYRG